MGPSYYFFYSIGTILAGFAFLIPAIAAARLWNAFLAKKPCNPWTLPLLSSILATSLAMLGANLDGHPEGQVWIATLGMTPSVVWCYFRRKSYRQAQQSETLQNRL